eukprot:13624226-Alexandrium_andersonii.AAC.1
MAVALTHPSGPTPYGREIPEGEGGRAARQRERERVRASTSSTTTSTPSLDSAGARLSRALAEGHEER